MKYVLDACAAIAFLRQEPGADIVKSLLLDSGNDIHVHAVNLIEIHYKLTSFGGDAAADEAAADEDAVALEL